MIYEQNKLISVYKYKYSLFKPRPSSRKSSHIKILIEGVNHYKICEKQYKEMQRIPNGHSAMYRHF